MSHLTPVQRPDKNGKIVTRHVAETPAGSLDRSKSLPMPNTGSNPKKLARGGMARLKTNGIDLMRSGYQNAVLYYLASVSPDLMESVVEAAVKATKDEVKVWSYYLGEYPVPDKKSPQRETAWHKYQNLAQRIPLASYLEENSPHASYRNQAVNLMILVDYSFPDKHEDTDFMKAASMVLHFNGENEPFKTLGRKPGENSGYLDEIEYIAKHVDAVEKIIPILRKRKSTKRIDIEVLLESGTASMAEGML